MSNKTMVVWFVFEEDGTLQDIEVKSGAYRGGLLRAVKLDYGERFNRVDFDAVTVRHGGELQDDGKFKEPTNTEVKGTVKLQENHLYIIKVPPTEDQGGPSDTSASATTTATQDIGFVPVIEGKFNGVKDAVEDAVKAKNKAKELMATAKVSGKKLSKGIPPVVDGETATLDFGVADVNANAVTVGEQWKEECIKTVELRKYKAMIVALDSLRRTVAAAAVNGETRETLGTAAVNDVTKAISNLKCEAVDVVFLSTIGCFCTLHESRFVTASEMAADQGWIGVLLGVTGAGGARVELDLISGTDFKCRYKLFCGESVLDTICTTVVKPDGMISSVAGNKVYFVHETKKGENDESDKGKLRLMMACMWGRLWGAMTDELQKEGLSVYGMYVQGRQISVYELEGKEATECKYSLRAHCHAQTQLTKTIAVMRHLGEKIAALDERLRDCVVSESDTVEVRASLQASTKVRIVASLEQKTTTARFMTGIEYTYDNPHTMPLPGGSFTGMKNCDPIDKRMCAVLPKYALTDELLVHGVDVRERDAHGNLFLRAVLDSSYERERIRHEAEAHDYHRREHRFGELRGKRVFLKVVPSNDAENEVQILRALHGRDYVLQPLAVVSLGGRFDGMSAIVLPRADTSLANAWTREVRRLARDKAEEWLCEKMRETFATLAKLAGEHVGGVDLSGDPSALDGAAEGVGAPREVWAHGDVKEDNIGVLDGKVVLFDLEAACRGETPTTSAAGTLGCRAPEKEREPVPPHCPLRADMFSAGVMMRRMLEALPRTTRRSRTLLRMTEAVDELCRVAPDERPASWSACIDLLSARKSSLDGESEDDE